MLLIPVCSVGTWIAPEPIPVQKDAPYFFDVHIKFAPAGELRFEAAGLAVQARFQSTYPGIIGHLLDLAYVVY